MNVANIYTKPRRTSLQNFNNTGEILIGHKVYVLPFGHKIDLIQQPLVPLFDPISFFCNETNQIKKGRHAFTAYYKHVGKGIHACGSMHFKSTVFLDRP